MRFGENLRSGLWAIELDADCSAPSNISATASSIYIEGSLSREAYEHIGSAFNEAIASGPVDLFIESPGGDACGAFELVESMRNAADESGHTVRAYVEDIAASAAYAIACVADEVYASRTARVASVGAVSLHVSQKRGLDAMGVDVTIVRSVDRKFEGSPFEELSEAARQSMQSAVDDINARFEGWVMSRRPLGNEELRRLSGATALAASVVGTFVDGIATKKEFAAMSEKSDAALAFMKAVVTAAPELEDVEPEEAVGKIAAWRSESERAEELASQITDRDHRIATLESEKAQATADYESAERMAIASEIVSARKLAPSAVYADDDRKALKAGLAEMSVSALRSFADALTPMPSGTTSPAPTTSLATVLTPAEQKFCRETGRKEEDFAAAKLRLKGA